MVVEQKERHDETKLLLETLQSFIFDGKTTDGTVAAQLPPKSHTHTCTRAPKSHTHTHTNH